jgi:colanic acid/amylovoran biosynthesis glycosyltransferase
MRLGYLVPEFPGQTHIFFWREVRALRRLGEDVFLVSTRRPALASCRHDFAAQAIAETRYLFPPIGQNLGKWAARGFQGLSAARNYLSEMRAKRSVVDRIRRYALLSSAIDLVEWATTQRIEHIHGHSFADSAHVLALARRMGGPPYSLTLHGDLIVYGGDHHLKSQRAVFVCAVGHHLRRQLIEKAEIPESKVLVTFMGVETSELKKVGKFRPFKTGSLKLLTVARLERVKGHLHALVAIHRARQASLQISYTIAGDGSFKEDLLSKVRELGLEDCVNFTGTVSEAEVYQLLENADAFVLPSVGVGEAWPVSVMEAMAAGLPVISSSIGATPDMISSGIDGILLPQGDELAIFENISLLTNNVQLRQQIGEAARKTAQRRFDVMETAGALRNAIRAHD